MPFPFQGDSATDAPWCFLQRVDYYLYTGGDTTRSSSSSIPPAQIKSSLYGSNVPHYSLGFGTRMMGLGTNPLVRCEDATSKEHITIFSTLIGQHFVPTTSLCTSNVVHQYSAGDEAIPPKTKLSCKISTYHSTITATAHDRARGRIWAAPRGNATYKSHCSVLYPILKRSSIWVGRSKWDASFDQTSTR